MNRDALFCDGTQDYVIPAEPEVNEKIRLRFRTAHNDVEEVCLLAGDKSWTMWKVLSGDEFDFYEIEWQLGTEPFRYSFEIKKGSRSGSLTAAACLTTVKIIIILSSCPDLRRRNGRRARSCIRSL